jgi:ATP-dependent Clp protease ATP-binding subunit ClpA
MLERLTPEAKKITERSLKEALQLGCPDIGPEHLLLAMLHDDTGIASVAFSHHGNHRELRQDVINYLLSEKKKEEQLLLSPAQVHLLVRLIQDALLKNAGKYK